ncbi:MAG: cation transporter [Moraxellaceae bacterium]|nr:MAG: cation transporter [Moraxellaceae bacterium]
MKSSLQNLRVQKGIVAISVILFLAKLVAWYLTGSVAILTDALESTVNVAAGFIGLYSLYVSAKPRDIDHPYGHGKAEFISAAIEGTLILVAGFVVIYEAVQNLLNPSVIKKLDWGILLVFLTAVINYAAGTYCINTGTKNNSLALIASGRHLRSDTYTTLGVVAGLILLYFTSIAWIDSAVAIVFACIIIYTGYKIIRSSLAGIMDQADEALLDKLIASLNANRHANWIDLHNLRIIKYGAVLHMDCHLTVPWYFNVHEAHNEIDALSALVRKDFGESVELFVHSDGCLDFSCPICIKTDCPVRKHPFVEKVDWQMKNILSNKKHQVGA